MGEPSAKFVLFEESSQRADIEASKGPQEIAEGYIRFKSFAKSSDILMAYLRSTDAPPHGLRNMPYDQPYQLFQEWMGGSWNDYTAPPVIQFSKCNLACPYCFADTGGRSTISLKPTQVWEDLRRVLRPHLAGRSHIRVSGGEPFLEQKWLAEFLRSGTGPVWIDTNLTLSPTSALLESRRSHLDQHVAICGCFKPGVYPQEKSLETLEELVLRSPKSWQIFVYYTANHQVERPLLEFTSALHGLYELDKALPLRLTVLRLNWEYSQVAQREGGLPECTQREADLLYHQLRGIHFDFLAECYPPEVLWLPSHQVPLEKKGGKLCL
jgi:organic radical activating enzyme